jgi:hypothetical protein
MTLKGINFFPILSKQRVLWQINETLAHQGAWWVGVKKRYTHYMWKLALLTLFSVKINGCENFLEQSNL